ncbi:acyl-[acyl-carrier-protein] thioesterase [Ligilactobacillus animalis]|uniref:Thioesterase n=1 Tax=Ligilactobacillus animalis TaxID=1605 RepID=A0AAJ6JZX1_9LACO|nr:acyl-ACP thioesterase domain-containing protein [Ligilactobacillus animalis]MBU5278739.1 acyl-ACP thioesterase [Ligilactobacillus animalis]MDO5882621.1 thioesterase [Ligilactobacillus animalis]MDQ2234108.1 thioesterase [Ligilactobacillus animalis]MDU1487900.1 thioesterase [Ligilactobacillus animalis]MDU8986850.1 thioesterase [Ligilactobacillus animalis]
MAENLYRMPHQIVYYETDPTGKLSLGKLVDLMMLASYAQGKDVGMPEEKLNAQGYGWVITQHLLSITRLPRRDEKVVIETKATAYNRYFCYRDFYLRDEQGELLAKMHTAFVLLDLETRKITRITSDVIAPFGPEPIRSIERSASPKRLEEVMLAKDYRVRYFDIDSNHHVNNVHYIEWMLDVLDKDFLMEHEPVALNIKYEHELNYGQTCTSKVELLRSKDELTTLHEIYMADGTLSCSAQVTWK